MSGSQDRLLQWAVHQPGSIGLLLLALGFLYGFHGFRFYRPLLGLTCAAFGMAVGSVVADLTGLAMMPAGGMAIILFVSLSAWKPRAAAVLVNGMIWAVLGAYIIGQLGLNGWWPILAGSTAGILGVVFTLLCHRTMQVILTTIQGAALLVVGIAGAGSNFIPSFGSTFCGWAASFSLLVPIVITVFFVTAYSYQALQSRGDMVSGV